MNENMRTLALVGAGLSAGLVLGKVIFSKSTAAPSSSVSVVQETSASSSANITEFERAANALKQTKKKLTDDDKLQVYALFKQATVGDNSAAKPSAIDFVAKAKWKAWEKLKGVTKTEAEQKYVALVEKLLAGEYKPVQSEAPVVEPAPVATATTSSSPVPEAKPAATLKERKQLTVDTSKVVDEENLADTKVFRGHYSTYLQFREDFKTNYNSVTVHEYDEIVVDFEDSSHQMAAKVYYPKKMNGENLPLAFYFHHGCFIAGNALSDDEICKYISSAAGIVIVSVEYPLSPEKPYPEGLEACFEFIEWAIDNVQQIESKINNTIDLSHIGVIGYGNGATLAASLCYMMKDVSDHELSYQILICPWLLPTNIQTKHKELKHFGELPSHKEFSSKAPNSMGERLFVTTHDLEWLWHHYVKDESHEEDESYLNVTGNKSHKGIPRTFIITAQTDCTRDEGELYAEQLESQGIDVDYLRCDADHFFLKNIDSTQTHTALDAVVSKVKLFVENKPTPKRGVNTSTPSIELLKGTTWEVSNQQNNKNVLVSAANNTTQIVTNCTDSEIHLGTSNKEPHTMTYFKSVVIKNTAQCRVSLEVDEVESVHVEDSHNIFLVLGKCKLPIVRFRNCHNCVVVVDASHVSDTSFISEVSGDIQIISQHGKKVKTYNLPNAFVSTIKETVSAPQPGDEDEELNITATISTTSWKQ